MARNLPAESRGPFPADGARNLVKTQFPELWPRQFNFPEAPEPVAFALGLDGCILLKFPLKKMNRTRKSGRWKVAAGFLMLLQEICQP